MPNYRRWHANAGRYFFTIVTYDRRPLLGSTDVIALLREAVAKERSAHPFEVDAAVVLPDHAHFLWSLPISDADYSSRIGRIKAGFTKRLQASGLLPEHTLGPGRQRGYVAVWQPRFGEHVIRDQEDFNRHAEYVHFNPVRHEYAACPHAWEPSSFGTWVRRGWVERTWCCRCDGRTYPVPKFDDIAARVGE